MKPTIKRRSGTSVWGAAIVFILIGIAVDYIMGAYILPMFAIAPTSIEGLIIIFAVFFAALALAARTQYTAKHVM